MWPGFYVFAANTFSRQGMDSMAVKRLLLLGLVGFAVTGCGLQSAQAGDLKITARATNAVFFSAPHNGKDGSLDKTLRDEGRA